MFLTKRYRDDIDAMFKRVTTRSSNLERMVYGLIEHLGLDMEFDVCIFRERDCECSCHVQDDTKE